MQDIHFHQQNATIVKEAMSQSGDKSFHVLKKFLPSDILGFLSVNQVHGDFTQWLCQSGAVGLSLSIERDHKFLVSHAKCFIHMTPRPSTKALLPCGPPAAILEKIVCPRQDMVANYNQLIPYFMCSLS